ncbi:hypothetical protein DM01DRAFT_1339753 [Hesseltinella vesiculosa]|uniref:C2H2-type domain-containing protein n=1 Tax=Hesseltinella vesiculosa TaxID=101127 RepID=A0A1X2G7E0_9FUNG|nr:hypothetical protein DM01DRAFT_1339753 [Hesseltinella vesiculosa]
MKVKAAKKTKDHSKTSDYAAALLNDHYPPTYCCVCGYQGSTRFDTDDHFRKLHKGNRAFKCMHEPCSQAFTSRPGLQYHLTMAHTIEKQNGKIVITSWKGKANSVEKELDENLAQQLASHYDLLTCPKCYSKFSNKTKTKDHIVASHNKEKIFKCFVDNCSHDEGFASFLGLVYHLAKYHAAS